MNRTGRLSPEEYSEACRLTQIVAIDLLVRNNEGKYLLGLRRNSPAKGTYFVPGSRVYKGESLSQALLRVSRDELGCEFPNCVLHGVYEHYYPHDSPSGSADISSHYVVFAFQGWLPKSFNEKQFSDQHAGIVWMTHDEICSGSRVHEYTKAYFSRCSNRFLSGSTPGIPGVVNSEEYQENTGMILEGNLPGTLVFGTFYPGKTVDQV
jgi:colanic acid biosynthesis protein WcaH